ncbi:MAG TPA: S24 family peptidase, partial [Candidatus Acidoferrales bacterium]|nr:S24 family peptidase [Candidatus Acidoferrales bacterium]
MEIPLLGLVAAGEPYQAFPLDETLAVPTTLWGGKQVFALRVRGSSMIDEGIHHGDYLIVEPRQTADNGATVVAEVDGAVTVKKYFREADGAIRLQPANPEMLPLTIRTEGIRIIGIVVGVLRKFGNGPTQKPAKPSESTATAAGPVSDLKPHSDTPPDSVAIDLAINAIDSQLVRWNTAIAHASTDRKLRQHVVEMSELGRDLQALREWCSRTSKANLRRALLIEANRIMRRMQRFANVTPVKLPLLH